MIKRKSHFRDPIADLHYLDTWVARLSTLNKRVYTKMELSTSLGSTIVWRVGAANPVKESLVIFPGARTTALFWDFDNGLDYLNADITVFLVETNGLPNHSDGNSPDIRSLDYGHWANEVIEKLGIDQTYIAGASFGALICMKLGVTHPEKIKAAFILNPGCLQPFSLSWKNLYYNLLPIIKPVKKNIQLFLDQAIFCKPHHRLSMAAEQLIIDYEEFAIKRYADRTQKPYFMKAELARVTVDVHLLLGDKDLLFPYKKSITNAQQYLKKIKAIKVFNQVGHGIETFREAIQYIGEKIKSNMLS